MDRKLNAPQQLYANQKSLAELVEKFLKIEIAQTSGLSIEYKPTSNYVVVQWFHDDYTGPLLTVEVRFRDRNLEWSSNSIWCFSRPSSFQTAESLYRQAGQFHTVFLAHTAS